MRVVIDTNIFVSGLASGGKPALVLDAMSSGKCTLVSSEEILAELARVLSGKKFRWPRGTVDSALDRMRLVAEMVNPEFELTDCADADDNRILEAAVAGSANCIVSGDKRHLLRMGSFRGIEILSADDFLKRLGSATAER
jgi:uncharacterized protein